MRHDTFTISPEDSDKYETQICVLGPEYIAAAFKEE
jgi:hypothetical protein